MRFDLTNSIQILERTPVVLLSLLSDLPEELAMANEGKDTWSPYDITGHLIHGEKTDWIERLKIILSGSSDKSFSPFDRLAQFSESKNKSLNDLLSEFKILRHDNVKFLKELDLKEVDFHKEGIHPDFGTVTLSQLLSTWAVHDLDHLAQISRVMAYQYKDCTGPWKKYLGILDS
ncbi:MAG TPA: DinB family protein [Ignavibacteria bacterium]|nr:DinB family protein [Ignavibacteria bacterium]HMR41120.1 DinB family protein [Ignavibacteria bacterium]